jgi:hypothetical protein
VPLEPKVHQGLHGEGFLHALASACGLTTGKQNLDVDGVDWLIAHPGPKGTKRSPKVEFQVKSWSTPVAEDGCWKYRLPVKHYNHLAGSGFDIPRFLALVIVPEEPSGYVECTTGFMKLNKGGYWLSLENCELKATGENDPNSVQVLVPQCNLLTPKSLMALLGGDLKGATQ